MRERLIPVLATMIVTLLAFAFWYLVKSFVALDFNVLAWPAEERSKLVSITLASTFVWAAFRFIPSRVS